ncbi:MAG: PulJ/GspJ family protein [Desulfobulbaceae bacterium]
MTMTERGKKVAFLGCRRGMTLLEILLAMSVLATVVSMVSLSLSGSLNVVEATRTQGELYYRAQVAMQRISEDVASAVLVEDVEFVGTDAEENGREADTLTFSSTAHVVFDPDNDHPGMALIAYSVVEDEENEGEFLLLRADALLTGAVIKGEEIGDGYLLTDRLRSVNFTYLDKEGEEVESWNTEVDANDPAAIRELPVSVLCVLEFWVDRAAESSITFSTRILLPAGLINAKRS